MRSKQCAVLRRRWRQGLRIATGVNALAMTQKDGAYFIIEGGVSTPQIQKVFTSILQLIYGTHKCVPYKKDHTRLGEISKPGVPFEFHRLLHDQGAIWEKMLELFLLRLTLEIDGI